MACRSTLLLLPGKSYPFAMTCGGEPWSIARRDRRRERASLPDNAFVPNLHVGFLQKGDPELVGVGGVGAEEAVRSRVHRQAIVHNYLAPSPVEVESEEVFPCAATNTAVKVKTGTQTRLQRNGPARPPGRPRDVSKPTLWVVDGLPAGVLRKDGSGHNAPLKPPLKVRAARRLAHLCAVPYTGGRAGPAAGT
jgi:hypothetical protein